MTRVVAVGLALAAVSAPLAGQTRVDRRAPLDARASIRIHNLVGSTRVIGWDRDSIAVTGTVADIRHLYFGASRGGAKLGVETGTDGTLDGRAAHLEVRVPRTARVWVKSATADITVRGVEGGLDLYAIGGAIVVEGRPAELAAESMDGPVTVETAAPWTRIKTASGTVRATGGDDVVLTSVSGPIIYRGSGYRRAHLETVSGDIDAGGAPDRTGRLEVASHSGAIVVALPPGVAAEFDIQSLYGSVVNGLTDRAPRRLPDLQGWVLNFATAVGGADVVIRSFKGTVTIR